MGDELQNGRIGGASEDFTPTKREGGEEKV